MFYVMFKELLPDQLCVYYADTYMKTWTIHLDT